MQMRLFDETEVAQESVKPEQESGIDVPAQPRAGPERHSLRVDATSPLCGVSICPDTGALALRTQVHLPSPPCGCPWWPAR